MNWAVWEVLDVLEACEFLLGEAVGLDKRWCVCGFPALGTATDGACCWRGLGLGRGRGDSSASPRETVKQKQKDMFCFGLGLIGLVGRCGAFSLALFALLCPLRFSLVFCGRSIKPSLSASVSRLDRCSRMGWTVRRGPGLDCAERLACSLCCQQYRFSPPRSGFTGRAGGAREAEGERAIGRRQGRPLEVMPRQVDPASFESERPRRDSGVLATKGIASRRGGNRAVLSPHLEEMGRRQDDAREMQGLKGRATKAARFVVAFTWGGGTDG